MHAWFRSHIPTKRDLLWFSLWIVLIGLLIWVVPKQLVREPIPLPPVDTIPITVPLEPVSEPIPAPPAPVAMSSTPTAVEVPPMPVEPPSITNSKAWKPDAEEQAGDARIVYSEEVKWLKEQLADARSDRVLRPDREMPRAQQLLKWVGDIPYHVETHGWALPQETLANKRGDCQDKSLLLATALLLAGFKEVALCRGVPLGYKSGDMGHAWVIVMINGDLWRLEATNGTMAKAGSGGSLDAFESVLQVWEVR